MNEDYSDEYRENTLEYCHPPVRLQEKQNAFSYLSLFETPFWTDRIEDVSILPKIVEHAKQSHADNSLNDATLGEYGDKMTRVGGRPKNLPYDYNDRSLESNGVSLFDDKAYEELMISLQKDCVRILSNTPENKSRDLRKDMIAVSNATTCSLRPYKRMMPHISPNNELKGMLILDSPVNSGELHVQDPAWIAKSMTSHGLDCNSFPGPEVSKRFSFNSGQIFIFPAWLEFSLINNKPAEDEDNDGIWFVLFNLASRIRSLNPSVVFSDIETQKEQPTTVLEADV